MLRFEKMTVKAQEAVQSAQEVAARHENQQIEPVHLLASLVAQADGVVSPLLARLGIRTELLTQEIEREIGRLPKVQGFAQQHMGRALNDVLEETGAEPQLVRELEEYGVIKGERREGEVFYDDTDREIVRAAKELSRYGVGGRNLRVFRTSADRESSLLEQILSPSLRSRNPERRKEAVEALENLAAIASHMKYLLLVRDLRKIAP